MPRVFPHSTRPGPCALRVAVTLLVLCAACSPASEDSDSRKRNSGPKPVAVVRVAQESVEGAFLQRDATLHPVSQVRVSTRQEGFVLSRSVEDGDVLHKGDPIAYLDDTEHRLRLTEFRAAQRRAEASREEAARAWKRTVELFERKVASAGERDDRRTELTRADADVAEATAREKRATEALDEFTIRAPMEAVVSELFIESGAYLERGDPIAHLKRINNMLAITSVSERYLSQIGEGLPVELTVTAYPGRSFEGVVWKIIPDASLESRSFPIRVLVPNPAYELKPGMSAQVNFSRRLDDALLVPKDSVLGRGENRHVFVVKDDVAVRREVSLGHAVGDRWHVTEGLTAEDWVIVTGNEELDDGGAVQIVDLPPPGPPTLPTRLEAGRPEGAGS